MKSLLKVCGAISALFLAGCGGVSVTAVNPQMPKPLIVPFPANVGLHYTEDLRNYVHEEERWGGKWHVNLGQSHLKMLDQVARMAFTSAKEVPEPKAPAAALDFILQPHIERFSFITPRDSGGGFFAVTIQYRLDVFAPDGRLADTLTFTGYGGARAKGLSSAKPLMIATQAAMRDAAAKFLVQFPEQRLAQRFRAGQPLVQEKKLAEAREEDQVQQNGGGEDVKIEPVPIIEKQEQE